VSSCSMSSVRPCMRRKRSDGNSPWRAKREHACLLTSESLEGWAGGEEWTLAERSSEAQGEGRCRGQMWLDEQQRRDRAEEEVSDGSRPQCTAACPQWRRRWSVTAAARRVCALLVQHAARARQAAVRVSTDQ
jgi:hypothetical protein